MEDELDGIEGLRDHVTQGVLEQTIVKDAKTQPYPLDGRNLELSSFGVRKKRRLARSVAVEVTERGVDVRATANGDVRATANGDVRTTANGDVSDAAGLPTTLWSRLYPFQQAGVRFLLDKFQANTGGLLADEMGLGKTVQVIAFVSSLLPQISLPILLIAPTTLLAHWQGEFGKWASEIEVVDWKIFGLVKKNKFQPRTVYLVSYETFRAKADQFLRTAFAVVILDEAQRIRNPHAKVTHSVKQLDCSCRIALSGSPIQNNLSELWSIFDFVAPGRLGTLPTFQEELAAPIEEGTKPFATRHQIHLSFKCAVLVRDLTAPLMLRRLKADYATELALADKEEQVLFCQLTRDQVEVYGKFLCTETVRRVLQSRGHNKGGGFRRQSNEAASSNIGKTFYCLSILRRIANHPDLLLNSRLDVEDFGSENRSGKLQVLLALWKVWHKEGRRCLVFSQSLGLLDILEETLGRVGMSWARMDGATPVGRRAEIVGMFDQANRATPNLSATHTLPFCLLLSTRVGGVGLNLVGADRVVIFDPDWNPMTDAQARERSWRIGQTSDVKIYRLIAAETVEEAICKRQIYKHHLAQKILVDPRQGRVGDWDDLADLFKPPTFFSATAKGGERKKSKSKTTCSVQKICALFDSEKELRVEEEESVANPAETEPAPSLSSLVTKVWNQDEIEMPALCASLVDEASVDSAAQRAVQLVLGSVSASHTDITIPTYTGKGLMHAPSLSRSKSLLSKIVAPVSTTSFDHSLVVEREMVKRVRKFFQARPRYSAPTDAVLAVFSTELPAGHADIFRSCLRQLCEFNNGKWTLKLEHQ